MMRPSPSQSGFTLIEAMVALAILGIASVGIIRAAEAHIDTLHSLERRAAAQWVAENALAEQSIESGSATGARGDVAMMGERWSVRTVIAGSADPDMRLVTISVAPAGTRNTMVTLRGFIDRGTITQ